MNMWYIYKNLILTQDQVRIRFRFHKPWKIDSTKWMNAMKDELKSVDQNEVWDLFELPEGYKKVGCKWVYKTKRDTKGNIERFKARLMAKGFTQKGGIDYKETFSPVSKKDSLRIIIVTQIST